MTAATAASSCPGVGNHVALWQQSSWVSSPLPVSCCTEVSNLSICTNTQCLAEAHSSFVTAGCRLECVCSWLCVLRLCHSCHQIHCPWFTPHFQCRAMLTFSTWVFAWICSALLKLTAILTMWLELVCSWLCAPFLCSTCHLCRQVNFPHFILHVFTQCCVFLSSVCLAFILGFFPLPPFVLNNWCWGSPQDSLQLCLEAHQ